MHTLDLALDLEIRPLTPPELLPYKQLRDDMLRRHPDAFTSDYETEAARGPESYIGRLGLGAPCGGNFLLGAWVDGELVGAVAVERDTRVKMRHIARLGGMLVRSGFEGRGIGTRLLREAIQQARQAPGLEQLVLSVTAGNDNARALYERHGFITYGVQPGALKIGREYFDKVHMQLRFAP